MFRQLYLRFRFKVLQTTLVGLLAWTVTVWLLNSQRKTKLYYPSSTLGRYLQPSTGKQHILVTGGAGYIGSHAVLQLLEEGHAVTILDNLSRGNIGAVAALAKFAPRSRLHFVMIDLGLKEALYTLFRSTNIDCVMHFAGVVYSKESFENPLQYYHNITSNIVNLLDAMQDQGVSRLIISIQGDIYGSTSRSANQVSPYCRAKMALEKIVRDFAYSRPGFQSLILRYQNVYGSDPQGRLGLYHQNNLYRFFSFCDVCISDGIEITNRFVENPIQGVPVCIKGSYVHVTDMVDAFVKGLNFLSNPPSIFDIGTDQQFSAKQLTEACKKVTGQQIIVDKQLCLPQKCSTSNNSIPKISSESMWEPQYVDLVQGFQHAWKWRQSNPHGYQMDSSKYLSFQ
eukprot:TRINITY_DN6430_c0_g1_i1.p1 TRINITY_DN6430_c0_g1~~TRINITY_DN6430_c0_g1_i1.p1  ORF type:complete len:416 (-),score=5.03 TRINITY_DN6430_c0_g1_i1:1699-2889(-)